MRQPSDTSSGSSTFSPDGDLKTRPVQGRHSTFRHGAVRRDEAPLRVDDDPGVYPSELSPKGSQMRRRDQYLRRCLHTWMMKRDDSEPEYVTADFARLWWKSLMANVVALVEDAALLASHESPGRAQSLIVLAAEELAKARWLYEAAEYEWSTPLGLYGLEPRSAGEVTVPEGLSSTRRPHAEKLQVAEQFASGLAGFWNLERRMEYYERPDLETFIATAKQRNLDKQAGFYVDRAADKIASPLEIPAEGIANAIRHTAKVVQMHLIEDHTRQQDAPDASLIDSVEDLHWAVMPYSDPELFAEFTNRSSKRAAAAAAAVLEDNAG